MTPVVEALILAAAEDGPALVRAIVAMFGDDNAAKLAAAYKAGDVAADLLEEKRIAEETAP